MHHKSPGDYREDYISHRFRDALNVIFLEFGKVFDKVPRERLLEKLHAYGLRRRTLNWIRNWLSG